MLDFIKATTSQPELIDRLERYALKFLQPHKPQNRNYICYSNGSGRFRFEFRKVVRDGQILGFREVELCFSPHYYFNDDLHNGNDFTPPDCIRTILIIMQVLGISEKEMQDFRMTNLEYGVNLNPETDVKKLITGIVYTKKTAFRQNKGEYSKISNGTKFKEIKAYAKGLQFAENPEFDISPDCFRFEVRHKQHKGIKPLGISTLSDLTDLGKYSAFYQSLIREWENILVLNDEVKNRENKREFWDGILTEKHRNTFAISKAKYYKNLPLKFNLRHLIKCKIIDKINAFQNCAYSTHSTAINKGIDNLSKTPVRLINLEFAHFSNSNKENIRLCEVTKLDISMQKKTSKYLCSAGLKWFFENEPETYQRLTEKYLTKSKMTLSAERQFYYIAHNIRNAKTNATRDRKRFEKITYHNNQLQITFN